MAAFKYKAKNAEGRVLQGSVEAESADVARATLRGRKLTVIELTASAKMGFFNRGPKVKQKDVVIFSRQLATMVSSGMALVQSVGIIAEQTEDAAFKAVLLQVRDDISSGVNIADSLAKHPTVFPDLYVNMVKAGETGGSLDAILDRLSTYLEKAAALNAKIKAAMMYPTVIAVVAVTVVVFLMVKVIPEFQAMFAAMGGELPTPTLILIAISEFLQKWILALIGGAVAFVFGISALKRTEAGGLAIDALMLKLPVFGGLLTRFTVARFSRTLGTLQQSGVPILEAMEIVAKTAGNKVVEKAIMQARASMREGEGVTGPLRATKVFPPMVIQMVGAGEETGRLDEMLMKIADFYDEEVNVATDGLLKLIEPLLMVVMGGTVGFIVIGMFMPLFEMSSMAG